MLFNFTFPKSLWRFLASTFVILIGCSLCKMESNSFLPLCALIYIGVGHRKQKSTRNQETHTWMSTCFECKGRVKSWGYS